MGRNVENSEKVQVELYSIIKIYNIQEILNEFSLFSYFVFYVGNKTLPL